MFTINDLSKKLVNNSDVFFINIIIDFLNNFINTYDILSKEEILYRINKLEYIGLSNELYRCDDSNATFGSGFYYYVALNKKNQNLDINMIKSYLYHELIHCLSDHYEKKKIVNGLSISINVGSLFDEIMTEYYSQILLHNENIINNQKKIIREDDNNKEYIYYKGSGYHRYMPLGVIYDYLFQNGLIKAKFIDNRLFIKKYNNLMNYLNINNLDYITFINETDFKKRFKNITMIFIKYLIYYYEKNNLNKKDIINDKYLLCFINFLSKEKIHDIIIPNRELYFYIYNELFKYIYKDEKILTYNIAFKS